MQEKRLVVITTSTISNIKTVLDRELKAAPCPVIVRDPEYLEQAKPEDQEVFLVLGKKAVATLEAEKTVPKNRSIGTLRQKLHEHRGMPVLVSHDPFVAMNNYGSKIDLYLDLSLALRVLITGSVKPMLGDYRWVEDFSDAIQYIEAEYEKTGAPVPVATDLETIGFNEFNPEKFIVSIFFTYRPKASDGVRFLGLDDQPNHNPHLYNQIKWLLTSPKVSMRGANLKFDCRWIYQKWKIEITNFKFDTTLVGSLLDENSSNSLENHTKRYAPELGGYDADLNKKYDKGRMDLIPDDDLLPYAGGDTDATHRVADSLKSKLVQDPKLANFYIKLLHPSGRAFEKMERTGILLDVPYYQKLGAELEQRLVELQGKADDMMGERMRLRHKGDLSLTKAKVLKDFMFSPYGLNLTPLEVTEKTGAPSTKYDHLIKFADNPDAKQFIDLLKDYSTTKKTLSTYVHGFMNHLREDGRLHPSYMLFKGEGDGVSGGTNSGRLSAKDPAVQCAVGETEVVTSAGVKRLDWLVEHEGAGLKVLTHTGKWRDIIGVYRNGVKPVFDVLLKSGHKIRCTGNHPILTDRGWVRTDELAIGSTCYVTRASYSEIHKSDLLQLDRHEEPLSVPNEQGLAPVRGEGNNTLSPVDGVQELPSGHGGETGEGLVSGAYQRERTLRAGELSMGDPSGAGPESEKQEIVDPQGEDAINVGLGQGVRHQPGQTKVPVGRNWPADGGGTDEYENPELRVFQESEVVSVTPAGEFETYDLTIDRSHSFIGNGIAVHNTIPKHSYWAKALRKGYIAPPGFVFFQVDYSQGELRVTACVANEKTMIELYNQGVDLHMVTGSRALGISLEQAMELKKTQSTMILSTGEKVDAPMIRQRGKAGNFGLIYGMQPSGFQTYAETSYGVKLSLAQSTEFRDGFFDQFSGLLPWHSAAVNFAKNHEYIRSPLGRVRHLPLINSRDWGVSSQAERQAINAPVQGTLSDLTQYTMVMLEQEYPDHWDELQPVIMTHDSLAGYVREDKVDYWIPLLLDLMSNLPLAENFGWYPQVKFEGDGEVGANLAELKDYKVA